MQLALELALLQQNRTSSNTTGNPTANNPTSSSNNSDSHNDNNPLLHPFLSQSVNSLLGCNTPVNAEDEIKSHAAQQQRRSQNMTECVPVPTSEHVAEIVGRQGKSTPDKLFII